jgi:hypothetical protein
MSNLVTRLLFDPVESDLSRVPQRYSFAQGSRLWMVAMGVGIAALTVSAAVGIPGNATRFLFAYLIAWAFCVSVALGALLFVMIQHLAKARWSTTLRRIPETIAANFPLLALAGLPVLFGMHDLFHWSHAELYIPGDSHYDPILVGKAPYFFWPLPAGAFPAFFVARYVLFFAVWSYLGQRVYKLSVRNDTHPSPDNTIALRKVSAYGIPLAAVTLSFASYDFLMSTDPHWFSTMFGVYFFAGGWLGALCLITFIALLLKRGGMVDAEITRDHIQDMGKFMFAFVVFWTYIAFSQYMLYWYANLPEEIIWFQKRFTGGWGTVSWSLLVFNFILPFVILIFRSSKRIYPVLAVMAVWLLVMHWVDLWWITMPSMLPAAEAGHAALASGGADLLASLETIPAGAAAAAGAARFLVVPPAFPVVEFLAWIGLFGLFLGATFLRLARHALTPYGDPYYAESLRFENV